MCPRGIGQNQSIQRLHTEGETSLVGDIRHESYVTPIRESAHSSDDSNDEVGDVGIVGLVDPEGWL